MSAANTEIIQAEPLSATFELAMIATETMRRVITRDAPRVARQAGRQALGHGLAILEIAVF